MSIYKHWTVCKTTIRVIVKLYVYGVNRGGMYALLVQGTTILNFASLDQCKSTYFITKTGLLKDIYKHYATSHI